MKHIIDSEAVEKLPKYWSSVHKCYMIKVEELKALLANSPQADGMVLVPSEPTFEMLQNVLSENRKNAQIKKTIIEIGAEYPVASFVYKAMLSAYKPQNKARE